MKISQVPGYNDLLIRLAEDEIYHDLHEDDRGVQWLLVGHRPHDEDDPFVQMAFVEGTQDEVTGIVVMNLWGTVKITVAPACKDLWKVVSKVLEIQSQLDESLA